MRLSLFFKVYLSAALLSLFVLSSTSMAQTKSCADFLKNQELAETINSALFEKGYKNPWAEAQKAAKEYENLPTWAKEYLPEDQVVALLQNPEMSLFITHLKTVLIQINKLESVPASKASKHNALKDIFQELPLNKVEKKIGRGELLVKYLFAKPNLMGALGFRDLKQMQNLVYGTSLSNPSENSLVGYYIKKTGAQHTMTGFKKGPKRKRGERRLALALSQKTMGLYKQLFMLPEFFYHVHYPQQGTLLVAHMGKTGSYANLGDAVRRPSVGSLMPMVLMSSSEGSRMYNYFLLAKIQINDMIYDQDADGNQTERLDLDGDSCAQYPWDLNGYCAKGGYTCCTHWVGNIPIGDKKVKSYVFPGNADENAGNADGKGPQSQVLKKHDHVHPMVQLVWQAPGHEQLAEVLNVRRANTSGELANPGWVLHTLVGATSPERVPVVFYVVDDHKEEIVTPIDEQTSPY